MLNIYYSYELWINEDVAILYVVMNITTICFLFVFLACKTSINGSEK